MAFYTDTRALRGASFAAGGKAATFGDYLGASAGDAWNDNPAAALYHSARLNHARYGLDQISDLVSQAESGGLAGLEDLPPLEVQNPLSLEEQKAQIRAEGLEGHVQAQEGYNAAALDIIIQQKHEELERAGIREQAPAWMAPFGFAAGVGASMLDPINAASTFIPVVGEARVLSMLRNASGAWGRAGVRAGVGAVEGAVGAALVEPLVGAGKVDLQQDYTLADSLMNVVFGAGMGAALHPLSGAVGDWKRARKGERHPWEYVSSTDATERLRLENARNIWKGMQESGSEKLFPEHAEAAAALWDATLRGYAYDTGELVDDLYRQYRTEYRGGKLEILRRDEDGLEQAVRYEQTSMGRVARASLKQDARDFGLKVDRIAATGKAPRQPVKILGQTPLVMQLLGRDTVTGKAAAMGGVYVAPHAFGGKHRNMTPAMWKKVPHALADPIAVFDSDSLEGKAKGDLVFMLEVIDDNGATVVIPVALDTEARNPRHARINIIKSAYSKEKRGNPSNDWFLSQAKKMPVISTGKK